MRVRFLNHFEPPPLTSILQSRQHFKADFSDVGLLTIRGCKHPEEMAYVPFPSTRRWDVEWKRYHKASFQNHVLQHLKVGSVVI